jgi:hypothetical protein
MNDKNDLTGEICGMCQKGQYNRIDYRLEEEGVVVEGFKCKKCGEIAFSEKVMRQIEAIRKMLSQERHIVQVGSSLAIPIPAAFVRKLGLKKKERVFVFEENGNLLIKTKLV